MTKVISNSSLVCSAFCCGVVKGMVFKQFSLTSIGLDLV